jgi:hypothetical protein
LERSSFPFRIAGYEDFESGESRHHYSERNWKIMTCLQGKQRKGKKGGERDTGTKCVPLILSHIYSLATKITLSNTYCLANYCSTES